jgi:diadenosine tetraphosphate (Ap4A) HIT family hydrolase
MSSETCPFCRPGLHDQALWTGEHYMVIPDEHPRCTGHLLVLSKAHLVDHADAPKKWLLELASTQARVRRFLIETFGRCSFWENGGPRKEVPHAHLHAVPVALSIEPTHFDNGVRHVNGWDELRREAGSAERYAYADTDEGRYFVPEDQYWRVLHLLRRQTLAQTDGQPNGEALARLGPQIVDRTRTLWTVWESGDRSI